MNDAFDDWLGLDRRDFSRNRLIVFHGMSGSGKSTAIRYLIVSHPDFRHREPLHVNGPPFDRVHARPSDVLVIDELLRPADLTPLLRVIARAKTTVVASHLPPIVLRLLFPLRRTSVFRTDRCEAKIGRALARRNIAHSPRSLAEFVDRFGASYTDLEIILERCPADSFDRSLSKFVRSCSIRLEACPSSATQGERATRAAPAPGR